MKEPGAPSCLPPLSIALTGNIASGKSTVASVLAQHGAVLIDADILARKATRKGSPGLAAVVSRFGDSILTPDGEINRRALGNRVFNDASEREALNAIVHPIVRQLREEAVRRATEEGKRIIVSDIPLLFESGLEKDFDGVILVHAPPETRLARIVEKRGLTEAEARSMVLAQIPSEEKFSGATWIIENTGTLAELRGKAEDLWRQLLDVASQRTSFHVSEEPLPGGHDDLQRPRGC